MQTYQKEFNRNPDSLESRSAYLVIADKFTTKSNPYKNLTYLGKKQSWVSAAQQTILDLSERLTNSEFNIINKGNIAEQMVGLELINLRSMRDLRLTYDFGAKSCREQ